MGETAQSDRVREFLAELGGMKLPTSQFKKLWPLEIEPNVGVIGGDDHLESVMPRLLLDPSPRIVWTIISEYVDFRMWLIGIDWLILSGSSVSPTDLSGLRRVIADCQEAGVPCWVRSLGKRPFERSTFTSGDREISAIELDPMLSLGDPSEWPQDLRVFETPSWLEG